MPSIRRLGFIPNAPCALLTHPGRRTRRRGFPARSSRLPRMGPMPSASRRPPIGSVLLPTLHHPSLWLTETPFERQGSDADDIQGVLIGGGSPLAFESAFDGSMGPDRAVPAGSPESRVSRR